MAVPSIDQISIDWNSRGFSCDVWVDPPGREWVDFIHDTDELVVVMEGSMEFIIDGKVSHPEIGDEVFIPAKAVHTARNIGTTTARWLYGYKKI